MLFIGSKILFDDNSGVEAVRIFHMGLKKTFSRSSVSINSIVKGSIINCTPTKKISSGDKINVLLIQVRKKISRLNGCYINFGFNYGIMLVDLKRRKPLATNTNLTVAKEIRLDKRNKLVYKVVTRSI